MQNPNQESLTDADIGIIDAMTTILEIMLAMGVAPKIFIEAFRVQSLGHLQAMRPNASAVLEALIKYVEERETRKKTEIYPVLRDEPPKGSA